MSRFLLGAVIFLSSVSAIGQQPVNLNKKATISGRIVDSASKNPIEYATITIVAAGTKSTANGTTANNQGEFEMTGVEPGNYTLVVEFIGYQAFRKKLPEIKKNALIDLKTIPLALNQTELKGVVVTSQQKLIDNRIDKMVFNAEKDLTSQGGVATDLLKKIPMVSVDVDGNVELSGNSSIRFLINGKPSTAFGSNIADVLQSIPASQIKSIEVITNPGAKYDAQGVGGIINIILKQNTARGINGNISLTAGTRMENGSFNFNAREGNFGINAFLSGNTRLAAETPNVSDRFSYDSSFKTNGLLHQDGESSIKRHGYQSGIGFDWTYKKNNSITGSLNYNDFGNAGSGFMNQVQTSTDAAGTILSEIASLNNTNSSFHFHNIDAALTYKRKFAQEDHELELNYNGSFGNDLIRAGNQQFLLPEDSLVYGISSRNPATSHYNEIRLDYTVPLKKKIILGAGGKISFMDIGSLSDVDHFQPDTKSWGFDSSLSNSLKYHQKVYALYTEISLPVKNIFDVKAGLRYERTEINSYYSNAQQQAQTPGYNTLVPSIYLLRKLSDKQTLKLSYSKRIERPEYWVLNPFINTSDPKNISAGNPYLKPEIGNRIELSYNLDLPSVGSFMVAAFLRNNYDDIQPYVVFYPSLKVGDSVYTNVSVSTRENIGTERNTGLNLFADLHVTHKLSIRSNLAFFYRHTINTIDPGNTINSFNYRLNVNSTYQFSNILAAEFFANFNSARNEVQGKYPSYTSYSFAVRKQFWNKKGSLALTATNPFGEYINQKTILTGNNFDLYSLRRVPSRSIGINFTWKFGKLEFKKTREEGGDNSNTER
ncbi:MAG: TonB-dependent receptor, partial [Chitinophagaceae bacterium]|nr:TonB-dependent receptor [Chitinophagaceae bacterium]